MTKTRIDRFFDDHFALARFAVDRFPPVASVQRVAVALAFEDNEADRQWAKLASYTLTELKWTARERPLTAYERQIWDVAERIYDSCVVASRRLGFDLWPEDRDKPAAREQLDRAFQRARLLLLKPKGEVQ